MKKELEQVEINKSGIVIGQYRIGDPFECSKKEQKEWIRLRDSAKKTMDKIDELKAVFDRQIEDLNEKDSNGS